MWPVAPNIAPPPRPTTRRIVMSTHPPNSTAVMPVMAMNRKIVKKTSAIQLRNSCCTQRLSTKDAIPIIRIRIRAALGTAAYRRDKLNAAVHAELVVRFNRPATTGADRAMQRARIWRMRHGWNHLRQRRRRGCRDGSRELVRRRETLLQPRVRPFERVIQMLRYALIQVARDIRPRGSLAGEHLVKH